jgi:sulfite reductase (NADPH) hemoprotein beta-component
MGPENFAQKVEEEWEKVRDTQTLLTDKEIHRAKSFFTAPNYENIDGAEADNLLHAQAQENKAFSNWLDRNVSAHAQPGYRAVTLSLKPVGVPPGDVTDKQLEQIADLADAFSFGEVRSTHEQNVVLADVKVVDLLPLWTELKDAGFATANIGTLTDMICCPGGDFCSLANAKSIPVADDIQREFDDLDYLYDLGDIELNISGCMNACGHHHLGHIGILGVDKKGKEFYQVQLGGNQKYDAKIGKVLGPSFSREEVTGVIRTIIETFVDKRIEGEQFLDTYERVGMSVFKEQVYATAN